MLEFVHSLVKKKRFIISEYTNNKHNIIIQREKISKFNNKIRRRRRESRVN